MTNNEQMQTLLNNATLLSDNGVDSVYQVASGVRSVISPIVSLFRRSGLHAWASSDGEYGRDYLDGKCTGTVLVRIPSLN